MPVNNIIVQYLWNTSIITILTLSVVTFFHFFLNLPAFLPGLKTCGCKLLFPNETTMTTSGDGSWGHLADTEHFGRRSSRSDYELVKKDDLHQEQYSQCTQAGHCMIYAKYNDKIFGIYNARAAVLMQMRFDGYIGFPGGLINSGEDVLDGLNRELIEELNYDVGKMSIRPGDYVISHWNGREKLTLHFYAKEVSMEEFKKIEKDSLLAAEYGTETMGIIRVPLYTMGDGYRGFPAFLSNAFVGNSREQLLQSLVQRNIMSHDEVERAVKARPV